MVLGELITERPEIVVGDQLVCLTRKQPEEGVPGLVRRRYRRDYDRNRGDGVDDGAIAGNHTTRGKAPRVGRPRADRRTYDRSCVNDVVFASRVRRKSGWRCICPLIGLARKPDLGVPIHDECKKFSIAF